MNFLTNLKITTLTKIGLSIAFFIGSLSSVWAAVGVFTQHNNLSRTGANLQETTLNIQNVNTNKFGLVFTRDVDDQIYAQPLVMTSVNIPGQGIHNIVIVATVNDSVYAFDADDASISTPYWQASFTNANAVAPRNSDMIGACDGNYQDFSGNIGIVSTPVIDPASGTIYVLARTLEFGTQFVQRLHALDISTGAEQSNSPVIIDAAYPGNGDGSIAGIVPFDPQRENQRAALTLVNGVVYICWAAHCDWAPYHGWIIGYGESTLEQTVVYNTTPEGSDGGIWMSGQGLSADSSGNLYASVGNGTVGNNGDPTDTINRGESFLKLTPSGDTLNVSSWFTPFDYQSLDDNDLDLGSAGILLIPNTKLALSGGKEGILYLVNRDKMGGLSGTSTDTNVVQSFQVADGAHQIMGAPVWWDGPTTSYAYVWASGADFLRQYKYNRSSGKLSLPPLAMSPEAAPDGMPGGILSVSANGKKSGTGIVWASHQLDGSANQTVRPGILRAFNAENVSKELWNSEQNSALDSVGLFAKFCPPTIANGKVYLATFSGQLDVYGLLPTSSNKKSNPLKRFKGLIGQR
jgi:hypothetical protein